MDLKKETKEIDGLTFKTQQLPAMRAFTLFGRLVKTIGPALGALTKLDPNIEIEASSIVGELAGAFSQLDADEAAKLVPEILASTNVERAGKYHPLLTTESINATFSGHLLSMFKCLAWVLSVNFGDFFAGSGHADKPLPEPTEG